MTVLSYFFSAKRVFHRSRKILIKQGFRIVETDEDHGLIKGSRSLGPIGPRVGVELKVSTTDENLTRLEVILEKGKSFLVISETRLKEMEDQLVEKLYNHIF